MVINTVPRKTPPCKLFSYSLLDDARLLAFPLELYEDDNREVVDEHAIG